MALSDDDSRKATKALRGEEGRRVGCEMEPLKKDKKRKRGRSSTAPPLPPDPSQEEHRATSSADDGLAYARALVAKNLRRILAIEAKSKTAAEILESLYGERDFSVEITFGDSDDGSLESLQARKIALLVSKSIVSLSSYAGGKRIRVCSGFVRTDNAGTSMILTSATLIRSLNGDNNVIPDVTVKVLLSDGHITAGHIFLVNFHYNVAVLKVAADLAPLEVVHLKDTTHNGAVLALGRAYEGGDLMFSRGQVVHQNSIFGCSDLLVSSCKVSMAGSGGPLVNYNGQVLGINFYEKNQTSHLPMLIVSKILEQHQSFGKQVSPWLGLTYNSLETMPLRVLECIYQQFPDVDQGLYISNVAKGSPADVAGLCSGDVVVKCNGKVLSSAPEFGAMLLDAWKEHLEASGDCAGKTMIVEVVIKRQRDGSTVSKSIAAKKLKKSHYNRLCVIASKAHRRRWFRLRRAPSPTTSAGPAGGVHGPEPPRRASAEEHGRHHAGPPQRPLLFLPLGAVTCSPRRRYCPTWHTCSSTRTPSTFTRDFHVQEGLGHGAAISGRLQPEGAGDRRKNNISGVITHLKQIAFSITFWGHNIE